MHDTDKKAAVLAVLILFVIVLIVLGAVHDIRCENACARHGYYYNTWAVGGECICLEEVPLSELEESD